MTFEKNNPENPEPESNYSFESHIYTNPDKLEPVSTKNFDIQAAALDYFPESTLTHNEKYQLHRANRELIESKENFLGLGNDGFVTSVDTSFGSSVCVKFVWERLDVIPGAEVREGELDSEILKLHQIAEHFKRVRKASQKVSAESNRVPLTPNKPMDECILQDLASKVLKESEVNCYIPEVFEINYFTEVEEDYDPYAYYLNESYATILMEQVPGKSVQDIILGFPQTREYIEAIDMNEFEKTLAKALGILHENNIRHQDITIRNVMFDFERKCPVIIDFGKSVYGSGVVSSDDEINKNLVEVVNHLRAFVKDPEGKRADLIEKLKEKDARIGV